MIAAAGIYSLIPAATTAAAGAAWKPVGIGLKPSDTTRRFQKINPVHRWIAMFIYKSIWDEKKMPGISTRQV
jgi:hypothetical protein